MVIAPVKAWAARTRRTLRMRASGRQIGVHVWLRGNPYHDMLYRQFAADEAAEPLLNIADLQAFVRTPGRLLAVHSEQSYSWGQTNDTLAHACNTYIDCLQTWTDRGGQIAWTIHDTDLHLADPDPTRIAKIRSLLVERAGMIHVHSAAARRFAMDELSLPEHRIEVIAHPSYAPCYPENAAANRVTPPDSRWRLLCFGYVKSYKNYDGLAASLQTLPAGSFHSLCIAGRGSDSVELPVEALKRAVDLDLQVRFIEEDEIPGFFNRADFLVLPYTQSLTSGATALALGFGVPVIAPDMGGMREAVADENVSLLYDPNAPDGLSTALEHARDMSADTYAALRDACLKKANEIHPDTVSDQMRTALRRRGLL